MARKERLRSLSAVVIGLTLLALLAPLPSLAIARGNGPVQLSAQFSAKGSNGYLLSVTGRPNVVEILVTEANPRHGDFAVADYKVQGTTSAGKIEADLGSFGAISMRFKPSGNAQTKTLPKASKACSAPRKVVPREGTFVGTFRFAGEADYTTVEAFEAKGTIGISESVICVAAAPEDSGKDRRHRPPSPYLGVTANDNHLRFAASVLTPSRRVSFIANSRETNGKVSITRFVARRGLPSSFKFDSDLSVATVTPPPPFFGTATFQRGSKGMSPTWSGSLAVSFPGAPAVLLTGPSITTAILERF